MEDVHGASLEGRSQSFHALSECTTHRISVCSPTQNLSEPHPFGFLWRLHYINMTDHWPLPTDSNSSPCVLPRGRGRSKTKSSIPLISFDGLLRNSKRFKSCITEMDMNLGKLWETVNDREAWHTAVHGNVRTRTWQRLNNNNARNETKTKYVSYYKSEYHNPSHSTLAYVWNLS